MEELITWNLPKSLLIEIEALFSNNSIEDIVSKTKKLKKKSDWKCVKINNKYYCEKWIDGAKITKGPYPECPSNCD